MPNCQARTGEVQILDAQTQALLEAQSGSIDERRHQPTRSAKAIQYVPYLFFGEDDREPLADPRPHHAFQSIDSNREHILKQIEERIESLLLSRQRDPAVDCDGGEEAFEVVKAGQRSFPLSRKGEKARRPGEIRLFGPIGKVMEPDQATQFVEDFQVSMSRSGTFGGGRPTRPCLIFPGVVPIELDSMLRLGDLPFRILAGQ